MILSYASSLRNAFFTLLLISLVACGGGDSEPSDGSSILDVVENPGGGGSDNGGSDNDGSDNDGSDNGNPFITTWKTDNTSVGSSAYNQIQIDSAPGVYDYRVDWGDGSVSENVTAGIVHAYESPGIYTVSITGTFPRLYFQGEYDDDSDKLLSVEQWGDIQWQSMKGAFKGCKNLVINATDAPDLSQVTDMSDMFSGAQTFNQNIGHWDVSTITNMSGMFFDAQAFNQDIGDWNVSNVTDMRGMFNTASAFNQDIGRWNVSNVTNMEGMFVIAQSFNQDLGDWNTSSLTDTSLMFLHASAFDQDLSLWNVSNVSDMEEMFLYVKLSTANYDSLLAGWSTQSLQHDVKFHAGYSQYSASSQSARDTLSDVFNWMVTDGGIAGNN